MWNQEWRETTWAKVAQTQTWDIIIVGGGITGAGILRQATALGLKTLLVEQRDFAWGTSSRSSKMVHGGLRYLKEGNLALVAESVTEREQLLKEGPGLIDPLGFLMPIYKGDRPGRRTYSAGLSVYDLLAKRRGHGHRYYKTEQFQFLAPHLKTAGLEGGFQFSDAQTDDARLVLRLIYEAVEAGGTVLNYVQAETLLRENEQVVGVRLREVASVATSVIEARAKVVINATGAWADELRLQVGETKRLRPLRGSHLVFASWHLPVAQVISFLHPHDRRPVFVYPWEGVTIVGTTDLDHSETLTQEAAISPAEVAYLMAAVESLFPALELDLTDILTTWAGVRPVVSSGQNDPSKEKRDHIVWHEKGLLTVTGGKLTTFRVIALDALKAIADQFAQLATLDRQAIPALAQATLPTTSLSAANTQRLSGRYGAAAPALVAAAQVGELEVIPGTRTLWAELRWAARTEAVLHLDDLLLRRVRLGLLLPEGGAALLPQIRTISQAELGWDDLKWENEVQAYVALWHRYYSLPDLTTIPVWRNTDKK
jgi:glycerol-3-phosphate dehydrogenase